MESKLPPNDLTCRVTLTRISGNDRETRDDLVIREATAALRVNGRPFLWPPASFSQRVSPRGSTTSR
jgi:hypothetical protein